MVTLDARINRHRAVRLLPPVRDAERRVEHEARALQHRRELRLPRPRSGPQPRCRGCNRFVGAGGCSCGWNQNGPGYSG